MTYKGLMTYILLLILGIIAMQKPMVLLILIPVAIIFYKLFLKKVYSSDMMDDRSTSLIKTAYPDDHYLLFPFLNSKEYEMLYNNNRYNSKLTFRFNSVVRAAYEKYKKEFEYKQTIKLQDLDNLDATINGIASYIIINCYPKDTRIVTQYFTSENYKNILEELQDMNIFNDNFVNLVLISYRQFKENFEEKNKQQVNK